MRPSTYLVTGAAGFIGAKVAEQLLDEGHKVVGVDNLNDAYDVRLKEWRLAQLQQKRKPGFRFVQLDIEDRKAVDGLFAQRPRFGALINLAARAGVRQSVANPWVYFQTNVVGTLNLLDACRRHGVHKFLLASTSSLYGSGNPRPFSEDADTSRPLSPYAASKKAAEALCHSYHHLYGLDTIVVRYFTVYGPAGRPDMSLFRFVQWVFEERPVAIYGDGRQERDFTFVDDIARGSIAALKVDGYQVINLGGDRPVVLLDALAIVEELAGKRARVDHQPPAPADVRATWANIDRARQLLQWEPQTRLEEGLSRLVDWYQANREWARDIRT